MTLYSAFLPRDRRYAVYHGQDLSDRVYGAAFFADLSGFTRLTATLSRELGPRRGAEELVRQLDRIFADIINEVHAYGGDVILFNGDALTCWFPETDALTDSARPGARAVSCGLAIQTIMAGIDSIKTPVGTVIPLAIQIGIAAGPARRFLVGSRESYLIEVLAGSTLDRMAEAEELAERGEVVVSSEVLDQLQGDFLTGSWRGVSRRRYAAVSDWSDRPTATPQEATPLVDDAIARSWLLPPVADRIALGTDAFLADLRPTVALFLNFRGIDYDNDDHAGAKLDLFVCECQEILARYEGYLVQVTMGDKGNLLYASFGAPIAHEDDAERAAAAALQLRDLAQQFEFLSPPCMGISRGLVYSGAYGSPERRTYSMLGGEVNVASRLMSAAQSGQILVSGQVAESIQAGFVLEARESISVKGIDHPFETWELTGRRTTNKATFPTLPTQVLIGREEEQVALETSVARLLQGESAYLLVEGAAGLGKSLLITDMLQRIDRLEDARIEVLVGAGEVIEQTTPYLAWQPIIRHILESAVPEAFSPETRKESTAVAAWLDPEMRHLAPLLNAFLPLNLAETQLTEQMSGEARQTSTQELIISILRKRAAGQPLAVIFDDAQWLDSLSWNLLRRVSRELAPLLVMLAARPGSGASVPIYDEFLNSPSAMQVTLDALPRATVARIVARNLGVTKVAEDVLDFIYGKAEGHPYFSEELAYALREAGLLQIADDACHFAPGANAVVMDFPDTIQGVITSRIDRLNASEQLTVKVASVIGRIFAYRVLRDIYPTPTEATDIRSNLSDLERMDIMALDTLEPDLTYLFKHIVTQEVVYSLMTSAQRKQLHENVARHYEGMADSGDARIIPLLAHHWSRAGDDAKAATYYAAAGEKAVRDYANDEAIQFLSEAVRLGREFPLLERARWHRLLAEVYYRLTRVEESQLHYEQAITMLGYSVPKSRLGQTSSLVRELARQVRNRKLPRQQARAVDPAEQARILEASMAFDRVSELYYNTGDELLSFFSVISALNLAEQTEPSPELVRGFGNLCATLGIVPLPSAANAYRERALAIARDIDHLPTTAWIQISFSVFSLWQGDWDRARSEVDLSMDLHAQLGDWRLWCIAAWLLPQISAGLGHLQLACQQWQTVYDTALLREDTRHQVRARGGQFFNYLALKRPEDAEACLSDVAEIIGSHPEMLPIEERLWYGMQARHALEHGNWTDAKQAVREQLEAIGRSRFKFDLLDVFATPAAVSLSLWEQGEGGSEEAKEGCRVLKQYARTYPFARACSMRHDANYHWLSGKRGKAERLWRESISQAEALGMPLEKILTLEAMAHFMDDGALLANATKLRAQLEPNPPVSGAVFETEG